MCGQAVWLSWSRTQATISLSSAEAEYYALTSGAVEARFAQSILVELGVGQLAVRLETDSSSAKAFSERPGVMRRKHIEMRKLFLKDLIREKIIEVRKI